MLLGITEGIYIHLKFLLELVAELLQLPLGILGEAVIGGVMNGPLSALLFFSYCSIGVQYMATTIWVQSREVFPPQQSLQ